MVLFHLRGCLDLTQLIAPGFPPSQDVGSRDDAVVLEGRLEEDGRSFRDSRGRVRQRLTHIVRRTDQYSAGVEVPGDIPRFMPGPERGMRRIGWGCELRPMHLQPEALRALQPRKQLALREAARPLGRHIRHGRSSTYVKAAGYGFPATDYVAAVVGMAKEIRATYTVAATAQTVTWRSAMDRRRFIAVAGLGSIAFSVKALGAPASISPAKDQRANSTIPVLILGVGSGGCEPLHVYRTRSLAQAPRDLTVYADRQYPRWRPDFFIPMDYRRDVEAGLDTFEAFYARMYERLDCFIEQSSGVIVVCGLGAAAGLTALIISNVSNIAKKYRKRSGALVSRPFGFEGSLRAGTAHLASERLRRQFDLVHEIDADSVIDHVRRPITLEKAYKSLDAAIARRLEHIRSSVL